MLRVNEDVHYQLCLCWCVYNIDYITRLCCVVVDTLSHTVAQAKVEELSQQLQEMNMRIDELQNKMKSKDEKVFTLENSISSVKERCAAKLKVCVLMLFCKCFMVAKLNCNLLGNIHGSFVWPKPIAQAILLEKVLRLPVDLRKP